MSLAVTKRRFSRRSFLKCFGVAGLGTVATGAYGHVVEPHWLEVGHHTIRLSKVPDRAALKVLHLSDLHASEVVSLDLIEQAIHTGLAQKPDLICLTGDYVTRHYDQWDRYSKILSLLPQTAPTFATLGNHDGGKWCNKIHGYSDTTEVEKFMDRCDIPLLANESKTIDVKGWRLNMVGLNDIWAQDFDAEKAFGKVKKDPAAVTLTLSHNPDTKDQLQPYDWDLLLAGHTHGGQVWFPFLGAPIVPVRDKRFIQGLHQWDNRWIHITRGVGNLYGIRINCRPEVSLLTLV
jgi:uncharacterized protein